MPFLLIPVVLLGAILVAVLLIPVSLVMRYRTGRTRRQARGWTATFNIVALAVSILLWLTTVAFTSIWIPGALMYALAGLALGFLLGIVGLTMTRWDVNPGSLHFTPNAWIVLFVTLVVAARMAYGAWRTWHAWETWGTPTSAVLLDSLTGSMAAAGLVLGYYLTFWLGVRRRIRRHQ